MPFIAAIDQGTTSTRFIIFNHSGNIVAQSQKEHAQYHPMSGYVEHDPLEILANTETVIQQTLHKVGLTPQDILAIGITNQRETTLVWNRHTGIPYHKALVWQDGRTELLVKKYADQAVAEGWQKKTGLPLATYFSALKLKWLLENIEGLQKEAENGNAIFGNIDAWIIWNLTGEHKTDVTNASRTQLMNLQTGQWEDTILQSLNIPKKMLPSIVPSSGYIATINNGSAKNIRIMGCLGDQQAALVGQTCFNIGEAKNTYGTGCFLLLNTGKKIIESNSGLISTVAYQFEGQPIHYALEGSIAVAGALVQWLRDGLKLIKTSSEVETLAAQVSDNGDTYIVPAFSGLFAPYWRTEARGIIAGLTFSSSNLHLARAVLEATAYQTMDVLNAMEKDSGIKLTVLNVDGGMVGNNLLMQFQADIARVPIQRPVVSETTCLGAAYASGLASGFWKNMEELKLNHLIGQTWQPIMPLAESKTYYAKWKKAVEKSFNWID